MAGFPGATGSLVPAHNILSTDLAFHVQLPIKSWGMQMRVGHWCSITVQRARRGSVNDWQLFCWVEEEQRTEAGIPSGKPVVSARSFYIWFPYLFLFFFPFPSSSSPPPHVSKHEAEKILSAACFTNTQPCQFCRLPRPHQQKIRLLFYYFLPPSSSKYMPLFRKAQAVSALRELEALWNQLLSPISLIFAVPFAHKKYDANLSTTHILHHLWALSVMKYLLEAQICRSQWQRRMKNNSNPTKIRDSA